MGVYVFESVHAPWIKVGHHLVSPRRPNAYYRVAGRGFESVVHPAELDGRLLLDDLRLLAWFPTLARADETAVHRACDQGRRVGEFHPADEAGKVLALCRERGGEEVLISRAQREAAVRWGWRRARAAKRRARGRGRGRGTQKKNGGA